MKRTKVYKTSIYAIFLIFILFIHLHMSYISDDQVNIAQFGSLSWKELVSHYWITNGRIFTDVLANLLYKIPMVVWKGLDSLIWVCMLSLIVRLFTKGTVLETFISAVILLTFPFHYLNSAGYIATSTNYTYTVFAILLAVYAAKSGREDRNMIAVLLGGFPVVYACGHDQSAVVFLSISTIMLIYSLVGRLVYKQENKIQIFSWLYYLVIGGMAYLIYFLSPGHSVRAGQYGGTFDIPGFENWTIFDKLYNGFTSTSADLIFRWVGVFFLFCVLIFTLAILHSGWLVKLLAGIPLIFEVLQIVTGYDHFTYSYENMFAMSNLIPWNLDLLEGGLAIIISFVIYGCIFWSIWLLFEDKKIRWTMIFLLLLGGGSRVMMGFASTLYGSSFRTFTILIFMLIICCVLTAKEIFNQQNRMANGAVLASSVWIMLCTYSVSYNNIW
ncbi:MAG: DUF6056 family protein [Lachnospiraceae bacterium]